MNNMKKYETPQMNIELFSETDIIATSSGLDEIPFLKNTVAGRKGADYGVQSASLFD